MRIISLLLAFFTAIGTFPMKEPVQSKADKDFVLVIESSEPEPLQIRLLSSVGETELSEEEYLTCVLLSEMPATFSVEAQKAQAVAARTFLRKTEQSGKHGGAICGEPGCCQAYSGIHDLQKKFGENFPAYWDKALLAVRSTCGETLQYRGENIDAVYYSCSGGRTEPAVAVWGREVPYLQSVESPGEESAAPYSSEISVPVDRFRQSILTARPETGTDLQIGKETRTAGGGVATMQIGNAVFTGTELRELFSLPSTNFSVTEDSGNICFHCLGNGHRVGMSQYGAEAMAKQGCSYMEILLHYYVSTEIVKTR